jgi:hypothetical protein
VAAGGEAVAEGREVTDRRCENCKRWSPPNSTLTGHGECNGIGDELFAKPEPLAAMVADPEAGTTLFTLPTFGCAMWESK